MLHERPDATKIDCLCEVVAIGCFFGHLAHGSEDTGVIVCHVEPAIFRDHSSDRGSSLGLVRHIANDVDGLVAGGAQRSGSCLELICIAIDERDGRTGVSKRSGGCQAHARSGACDERDLAFEVVGGIHQLFSFGLGFLSPLS
jgi:hypothetical protein